MMSEFETVDKINASLICKINNSSLKNFLKKKMQRKYKNICMGSFDAQKAELIKYIDRRIKINNTLIALKNVNFEEIKIWQEFWSENAK